MLEQLQKDRTYTSSPEPLLAASNGAHANNGIPGAVTPLNDYISVYQRYQDYKKAVCLARLTAMGLPMLEGFVIRRFNNDVLAYLGYWMRQRHLKHLMVFFDSCQETEFHSSAASQMFTLAELSALPPPVPEHVAAIVLEGDHQLQQSHAVVTAFLEDHITCEIVGPGFAIEDLTHGRIIPHEWFSFRRKERNDDRYKDLGPADLLQHTIITPEAYLQTIETRYNPLYNSMWSYPAKSSAFALEQELAFEPEPYDPLFHHQERYMPISYERLSELYSCISELDLFYPDEVRGKLLTASFLQHRGLVFWSISGLSHKY